MVDEKENSIIDTLVQDWRDAMSKSHNGKSTTLTAAQYIARMEVFVLLLEALTNQQYRNQVLRERGYRQGKIIFREMENIAVSLATFTASKDYLVRAQNMFLSRWVGMEKESLRCVLICQRVEKTNRKIMYKKEERIIHFIDDDGNHMTWRTWSGEWVDECGAYEVVFRVKNHYITAEGEHITGINYVRRI